MLGAQQRAPFRSAGDELVNEGREHLAVGIAATVGASSDGAGRSHVGLGLRIRPQLYRSKVIHGVRVGKAMHCRADAGRGQCRHPPPPTTRLAHTATPATRRHQSGAPSRRGIHRE